MSTNAGSVRRNGRDSLAANHEDQLILDDSIPFDDEHQPVSAPATPAVADISHDNNTVIQEVQSTQRPTLANEQRPGGALPGTVPPYDTSKYRLGRLCPRGHDYHGTGQSLRTNNRSSSCRACDVEQKREKRQARRQATAL